MVTRNASSVSPDYLIIAHKNCVRKCLDYTHIQVVIRLASLKLLLKSPTYCDTLRDLGDGWKVDDDLLGGLFNICSVLDDKV